MRRSRILKPDEKPVFHCPRCGAEISSVVFGCGWDYDSTAKPCPNCKYDGSLETITGVDPDGTVWQLDYSEEEKNDNH